MTRIITRMNAYALKRQAGPLALTLAFACIAWFLYQRHAGLQPTVFADEWYYSKLARLTPIADAILPSYLYLWIFSASKVCGDGFLDCVRAGNLAFLLASTPFVYLIARRYMGQTAAAVVALLSTLAPLNSFTAYFMPESTYYFGFCVLSWTALCGAGWRPFVHAMASGAVLGLMSLVKVHAVFLLPALCPFLLAASRQRGGAWVLRGLAMATLAAAVALALKFGLGWLFAGKAGLSLFGSFYDSTVVERDRLALLGAAAVSAAGHLMALAPIYGLPLAILVHATCACLLRGRAGAAPSASADLAAGQRHLLHLYVLLMLGAAAGLTVVYTAGLAIGGSREGLRLHLRYYNFVFPLLAVVAAAAIAPRGVRGVRDDAAPLPWLRWVLAILLGAALLASLFRLQGYVINIVDGPDIAAIGPDSRRFQVLVVLQLLLLLAWAARRRAAPLLYLCLALPLAYAASQISIGRYFAAQRPPTPTDVAARFVHDYVAPDQRDQVVIAGVDVALMMRAQFHIDHPDTVWRAMEFGPVAEYQLPVNKKWLLLLGQYEVSDKAVTILRTPYYSFVRLPDQEPTVSRVRFSAPADPNVVVGIEGLSRIEPWGRWSDAKHVTIRFAQPLPRRVGVVLTGRAYDVNAELPFRMRIGNQVKEFRLGWHDGEIGLHFDIGDDVRTIDIEVPQPVSPEERGHPGDTRKLGIGIAEFVITDGTRSVRAGP